MNSVDDIKARADCREVARAKGARIKRANGDTLVAHCWHPEAHNNGDANPSMSIGRGGFKCFGCGASGDVITLAMELDGADFKTARDTLAAELGISDSYQRPPRTRRAPKITRRPAGVSLEATPRRRLDPVNETRAEVWGRIWEALVFSAQPDAPKQWAESRGISWQAATLASVRDPTDAAAEIVGILRDYTLTEHKAAGTVNQDGKPWHPLRIVKEIASGDRAAADGAFIPMWSPPYGSAPVGMRYRLYEPWANGPKSLAQFSGAPILPLGLDKLDMMPQLGEPFSVLICEGETDWLAAQDAMRALGHPAACLAHCMMSKPWAEAWTRLIAGAESVGRVLVLFDRGPGDRPNGVERAREIAKQLAAIRGADWTRARLSIELTDEGGEDLADLHKKGDLTPLLERLLLGRHAATNEAVS